MNLDPNPGESRLTARRKSEYRALLRGKGRREAGQYLIEGVRALESAVQAGVPLIDAVVDSTAVLDARTAALMKALPCPVHVANARDLAAISDVKTSQGIVAAADLPRTDGDPGPGPCLVLDGIQDPGNVGTLIRTAAWFGVRTVLCGPGTADPFQPKVVRSSQGGLWDVAVVRREAVHEVLRDLEDRTVFVADLDGGPAGAWFPEADAALVIGSEARGPSPDVKAVATRIVTIEGAHPAGTESLNAAVAGGILMHRWLCGGKPDAASPQ